MPSASQHRQAVGHRWRVTGGRAPGALRTGTSPGRRGRGSSLDPRACCGTRVSPLASHTCVPAGTGIMARPAPRSLRAGPRHRLRPQPALADPPDSSISITPPFTDGSPDRRGQRDRHEHRLRLARRPCRPQLAAPKEQQARRDVVVARNRRQGRPIYTALRHNRLLLRTRSKTPCISQDHERLPLRTISRHRHRIGPAHPRPRPSRPSTVLSRWPSPTLITPPSIGSLVDAVARPSTLPATSTADAKRRRCSISCWDVWAVSRLLSRHQ